VIGAAAVPPGALAGVAELVEARAGLRFVDSRRTELEAKLRRVFAESGCESWEQYVARLTAPNGGGRVETLLEALVVGETYFFRHRSYFEMLEREVLPALIVRRGHARRIRLWCAGCATGEEAYSLAIVLRRVLPDAEQRQAGILATDLSRAFLTRGEEGMYGEWSFRETDAEFKAANFTRDGDRYRVRPELRRLVSFQRLNLVEDGYPSQADGTAGLDLILCRNVLIYFAPSVAARVLARLRTALVPGGYLVLGPSDLLPGPLTGFEPRAGHDAFVFRRVEFDSVAPPPTLPAAWTAIPAASPPEPRQPVVDDNTDWLTGWRAAREHADRGHIEEAAARCREAIASARHRPEPYYLLGTLYQLQGNELAAIAALRQALYVDRGFAPAHLALAAVHRQAGRPKEARRLLLRGERVLEGRAAGDLILADEGLTVGRLRDVLARALTYHHPATQVR
jgi:chemotaxis protein methyltransferase CheR